MARAAKSILVVEDHDDTRDGISELLTNHGYHVVTAANGREALASLYRGLRPCIIVLDLMMPVMSGYEFRQEQLRDDRIAHIPVIAYSGVTDVRKNAAKLDAEAYLQKPFESGVLLDLIQAHCLT